MPPGEEERAPADGEPDYRRRVVSRRGEVLEFDDEAAAREALARTDRSGRPLFSADTPETREERRLRREYGDRPLAAGAAGAARGATFGLSDTAGNALGYEEDLAALQRLNPEASMVGEVAGNVVPVLALGPMGAAGEAVEGAGLLARGARALTAPARMVAGLGEGIGTAAGNVVRGAGTSMVRRGLGTVTRLGVEGAVEGAFSEGGRMISEEALGDPNLTAQAILARLGTGALMGAGGGAVLGAGGAVVGEGVRATRRAAGGAADLLRRTWGDSVGTELSPSVARMWALTSGADPADIARFTSLGAEGRRLRGVISRGDDVYDAGTREIAGSLDALERGRAHGADFWSRGLKRDQVVRRIAGGRLMDQAGVAAEAIGSARNFTRRVLSSPGDYAGGTGAIARRLDQVLEARDSALARALDGPGGREAAADIFSALDEIKREIGRARTNRVIRGSAAADELDGLYESVRTTLERSDLWGEAADIQRDVNRAFTAELSSRGAFRRRFLGGDGARDDVDPFRTLDTTDTRTIAAFLRQAGTVANETAEGTFEGTIGATRDLLRTMDAHLDLPANVRADIAAALRGSDTAASTFNRVRSDASDLNQWRRLQAATDSTSRGVAGAIAGAAVAGPLGAVASAALANPAVAVRALGTLERIQSQMSDQIGDAIRSFIRRGRGTVVRTATEGGRRGRAAAVGGVEAYRARVAQMDEDRRNPRAAIERVASRVDGLEAAPAVRNALIAAAVRGQTYLAQHRPGGRATAGQIFPDTMDPSAGEISDFLARARAIDSPASVIADMARGDISPASVDALRVVYPDLYNEIRSGVVRALAQDDARLSYQDRLALGILLDMPTDPALAPSHMAVVQSMYAAQAVQAATPSRSGRAPDVAAASMSATDALASRRV
jgi:hypothetical protein